MGDSSRIRDRTRGRGPLRSGQRPGHRDQQAEPVHCDPGTYQAYTGLANLVSGGQDITTLPPQISSIGNTNLFGWISIPVVVAVVIFLILSVMLRKTRFGKYIYVIGDSEEAAVRAGIKVKRHMVILFTLSGTVSAVAGILQMTRLADASPSAGTDLLLNSIAATIIGGTSLAGGRGSIGRTVVGGLIISILLIGLVISNVQPYWQQVAIGAVIVLAVFIDEQGKGFGGWRHRILRPPIVIRRAGSGRAIPTTKGAKAMRFATMKFRSRRVIAASAILACALLPPDELRPQHTRLGVRRPPQARGVRARVLRHRVLQRGVRGRPR